MSVFTVLPGLYIKQNARRRMNKIPNTSKIMMLTHPGGSATHLCGTKSEKDLTLYTKGNIDFEMYIKFEYFP